MSLKAYKVFNNNWTCNGFQYEVGKRYKFDDEIEMCSKGFHACEKLEDCFKYYASVQWNKIAEVIIHGKVLKNNEDSKVCTDDIEIVKEISFDEIKEVIKKGVDWSEGVANSNGVDRSEGVAWSNGVAWSKGVARSEGVASSIGILNCSGISKSIFTHNKKPDYLLFNKKITEKKYSEIMKELNSKLNGWTPTFNNLKSLWIKAGNDWKQTPIPNAAEIQKEVALKDMPKEAIDYLRGLKEFNSKIFFEITGIKVKKLSKEV